MIPVGRSLPTVASMSPKVVATNPLRTDLPARLVTVESPKTIRANVSAGPNCSATLASGGPSTMSRATPIVPAMKEPMAAMESAGPARPFRAIW